MAQVTIKLNGFSYTVGCEDGQEQHLLAMADQVESRIESIKNLKASFGQNGSDLRAFPIAKQLFQALVSKAADHPESVM